jgi:hypothetical protein
MNRLLLTATILLGVIFGALLTPPVIHALQILFG